MDERWAIRRLVLAAVVPVFFSVVAFGQVGPLLNSGFEALEGALPADWKVFVAPQPGATGEAVSEDAYEGRNCVRLHIPTPYNVEPANNFSQPLPIQTTGVRVRVSGYIKTKDATEAAIWLQCFRREPWMVLKQVTTSTDSPVYGTMNWTPVEFETLIPTSTDFAMIRCVLKGHGTAWFDNVEVTSLDEKGPNAPKPKETAERETPIEAAPPDPKSISPRESKPVAAPRANAEHDARVANEKLRESNEALAVQLQQLQAEIAELRDALIHPPPLDDPALRPPPLVPHGYQWEDYQD